LNTPKLFNPHLYQERAIDLAKKIKKLALWLPMGAGKSAIGLSLIKYLRDSNEKPTLIVAPKTVVFGTWMQESLKWEQFKHLKIEILHGKNKDSIYLANNADIYLLNYEGLAWLESTIIKHKRINFNTVIFDESSKLKSWSTKRFKICRKLCNSVDRVVLLSATPSPNHYLDLWSQYFLLDKGGRLGKTVSMFRSSYFHEEGYEFKKYILRPGGEKLITEKVSDITFRIDEKELPYIPEMRVNTINVVLDRKTQDAYNKFEKTMFYELESLEEEGIEAFNAASLTQKCRQFAQGFLYHEIEDGKTRKVENVHTHKIDALKDIVEGMNGTPLLIAYNFKHELNMILEALGDVPVIGSGSKANDIKKYEKLWNDKKLEVLLCNPASVSHGLNLQKGGHHILWFSLTWSWEQYTQLIGRLHRQGQVNNVRNHVLIAKDTIDEAIFMKLKAKEQNQRSFLDALFNYQQKKLKNITV
jgi:superfamily II DNA or RNA helicase